jgi:hypothetical protein
MSHPKPKALRRRASANFDPFHSLCLFLLLLAKVAGATPRKTKSGDQIGLRFLVFRLSASQFLKLEARAELHLERNARIVADDEIAVDVSQLSEVQVGWRAETAANE